MHKYLDFIFDNAYKEDAKDAESRIRQKYPLLLHEDERVELAFKNRGGMGRDKEFFTSHRILIKDGKGIGSKRKNYLSVPYDAILAFSVQSAGYADGDVELRVYTSAYPCMTFAFAKDNVDIFQIYQYLNTKVNFGASRGTSDEIDSTPPNMDQKQSGFGNVMDWLGDNNKQVEALEIEKTFKEECPILLKDEKVEIAFKSGRDTFAFTDKRILKVDVKGFGKQVEFLTLFYTSIHGFSVQTAGAFLDRDTEMKLYTNMFNSLYQFDQDFRNGKANLFAIQKILCNHVLGDDNDPLPEIDNLEGHQDTQGGFFEMITGLRQNQRPIDAVAVDKALHSDPPILQGMEKVEMAFQGHRDITVFTTKRCIIINPKGLVGKQIEYFSLPWEKVMAFGIRTAGAFLDFDTEVLLYTEMTFYPGEAGSSGDPENNIPPRPPIPPRPEESCWELDFNKDLVDLFQLKYYLSRRIMEFNKLELGAPIDLTPMTNASPDPKGFERLFQWLGSDQREIDPTELDEELHTNTKILLDNEKCLMAFKSGRDVSIFTNIRVLIIDVQGLVGCKIEYTTLPYRSICAYSITSAGVWDRDSELNLYTRNRWHLAKVEMDFRQGKTDIMQVQRLLSTFIVGLPSDGKVIFGPKDYGAHERAPLLGGGDMGAAILSQSTEIDAGEMDAKFRFDYPLLLEEEKVVKAFQQNRDMFLWTTRRWISIDAKGLHGQKVKYKSVPYKYMKALEFETCGNLDNDAEIYGHTTVSAIHSISIPRSVGLLSTKQSILVKSTDIYEMGKLLLDHTIFGEKPRTEEEEPEIEVIF